MVHVTAVSYPNADSMFCSCEESISRNLEETCTPQEYNNATTLYYPISTLSLSKGLLQEKRENCKLSGHSCSHLQEMVAYKKWSQLEVYLCFFKTLFRIGSWKKYFYNLKVTMILTQVKVYKILSNKIWISYTHKLPYFLNFQLPS